MLWRTFFSVYLCAPRMIAVVFFFSICFCLPPPTLPLPAPPPVPISLLVALLVPVAFCFWSKNKLGTRLRNLIRLLVEILDFGFCQRTLVASLAFLSCSTPLVPLAAMCNSVC